jgi:predicted Ser/Thr protein kinase
VPEHCDNNDAANPVRGQYDVARIPPKMLRGKLAPDSFELDGVTWRLEKHLKADFFASTGRYVAPDGRRVCYKHFHTERYLIFPLGWAGRYMCRREMGFYRLLSGVEGIPELVGRHGRSTLVHQWIDGADLLDRRGDVPDDFFDRLAALTDDLHARGVAYVDMNKPDNVLVGDDGRPYLVDFQISFRRPPQRWRLVGRWLFKVLCREDRYHVCKLKRKMRRDLMSPEELASSYRRSWLLSVHRKFAHPFQRVRRWLLTKLGAR